MYLFTLSSVEKKLFLKQVMGHVSLDEANNAYTEAGYSRWTNELNAAGWSETEISDAIDEAHYLRRTRLMLYEREKHLQPVKQFLREKLHDDTSLFKQLWDQTFCLLHRTEISLVYIEVVFDKIKKLFSPNEPVNKKAILEASKKILISEREACKQLRAETDKILEKKDKVLQQVLQKREQLGKVKQEAIEELQQVNEQCEVLRERKRQLIVESQFYKKKNQGRYRKEVIWEILVHTDTLPQKRSLHECQNSTTFELAPNKLRKIKGSSGDSQYQRDSNEDILSLANIEP